MLALALRRCSLLLALLGGWCALVSTGRAEEPLRLVRQGETTDPRPAPWADFANPPAATMRVIYSLAVVLGLFALWTAFERNRTKRVGASALIASLGAIQLTPKVKLHIVRMGRRLLLLHLTAGHVETVAEISDPEEVRELLGGELSRFSDSRVEALLQQVDARSASSSFAGTNG